MASVDYPGLTVSVPLFFKADECIDFEALDFYLEAVCVNSQISAIYSMAYNTRYRMLSFSEVLEINRFVIAKVLAAGHKVYVGHPYIFTRNEIEKYLGALTDTPPSGVSMLYPERYYNIDEPVVEFLRYPAKYGLDVVLHEMKLISGFNGELVNWPDKLLERVFTEVPLVAIKEDSKDDTMTQKVLGLCEQHSVHCVLAGGGKRRAERFIASGMSTWLNGSTMFLPELIDRTYKAFVNNDLAYKHWYVESVEKPFFDEVVAKYGWHLAHKAALEFFGFGERHERFPHAVLDEAAYSAAAVVFSRIKDACLAANLRVG